MNSIDRLRVEIESRRNHVRSRLSTSERAMETSLDKILVRAASSGTTAAGAPGAVPQSSTPPPPAATGPGPWIAGAAVLMGGGLLVAAVVTAGGSESADSATAPLPVTTVEAANDPVDAEVPSTPDDDDAAATTEASITNVSTTTPPTVQGQPDVVPTVLAPVLIATDDGAEGASATTGGDTSTGADAEGAASGGPTDEAGATTNGGAASDTGDTSDTGDGAPTTSGEDPPPPPSAACGARTGLPPGAVAVVSDAGDFDDDGIGDRAGLYNTVDGASIVIDRSAAGLTDVGRLGEKPVGDLSADATIRGVRPEGSEFDIGLVIDDLDDDGASVWVRPFALAGCLPTALELPRNLGEPDGEVWSGANYTAEGRDYGLQCLDEGELTALTFLDNDEAGALLAFVPDGPTLDPSTRNEATNPGCWT